eukprot:s554_g10.t1
MCQDALWCGRFLPPHVPLTEDIPQLVQINLEDPISDVQSLTSITTAHQQHSTAGPGKQGPDCQVADGG